MKITATAPVNYCQNNQRINTANKQQTFGVAGGVRKVVIKTNSIPEGLKSLFESITQPLGKERKLNLEFVPKKSKNLLLEFENGRAEVTYCPQTINSPNKDGTIVIKLLNSEETATVLNSTNKNPDYARFYRQLRKGLKDSIPKEYKEFKKVFATGFLNKFLSKIFWNNQKASAKGHPFIKKHPSRYPVEVKTV